MGRTKRKKKAPKGVVEFEMPKDADYIRIRGKYFEFRLENGARLLVHPNLHTR